MTGAGEFAEVEARILRMTDGELVEMIDSPDDYEPWALDIGRAEFARRSLAPEQVVALHTANVADATEDRTKRGIATRNVWVRFGVLLTAAIAAALGVGRGSNTRREPDELSVNCASLLAKAAGATSAGNVVKLGRHAVTVTASIERVVEDRERSRTIAGVAVACEIHGARARPLTTWSIGIAATRDEAVKNALEDWITLYGNTIADALSGKGTDQRIGAFAVYSGPTGLRGAGPDDPGEIDGANCPRSCARRE
ncbi:MAG TPA: DUF6348 family protein [Myxococcales bacterium]